MEYLGIVMLVCVCVGLVSWFKFSSLVKIGQIHYSDDDKFKWSEQRKPNTGGKGLYLAFVVSICLTFFLSDDFLLNPLEMLGLFAACSMGFALGLKDDKKNMLPYQKLIGQALCGLILFYFHWGIGLFDSNYVNFLATIFWVILVMNSINMVDNMDGISSNVAVVIILFFGLQLFFYNNNGTDLGMIILNAVVFLLVFMKFNNHPSLLFMGDSGSQFLGVFLAALGINYGFNNVITGMDITGNITLTLLIFWATLNDTLFVTINRAVHKISPFVGGRDHSSHNLAYLGMKDETVMLVFRIFGITNFTLAWMLLNKQINLAFCMFYMVGILVATFAMAAYNLKRKKYCYR